MLRRALAVLAGFTVCQFAMLACLAIGAFVMLSVQNEPVGTQVAAVVVVIWLLLLPGMVGGALAGFLSQRRGWLYGGLSALLFALTITGVQLIVTPYLGGSSYDALQIPPVFASLILTTLAFTGAFGGFVGQRRYLTVRARQQARATRAMTVASE